MTPIFKGGTMIIWGNVTSTKGLKQIKPDNGKNWRVCDFSVAYGEADDPDNPGSKLTKYMSCSTWGGIADYAARLEKGDKVFVCGQYEKDQSASEYYKEDRYHLKAEFISVMEA